MRQHSRQCSQKHNRQMEVLHTLVLLSIMTVVHVIINCDSHSGQNVQMNYLTENILFLQILPWFHPAIDALAGAAPLHWPTSDIENRETLTLEVQRRVWFLWTRGKNPVQHGGFLWDRQFITLHDETVSEMLSVKHFTVNLSFFLLICKHLISNKHFFTLIL